MKTILAHIAIASSLFIGVILFASPRDLDNEAEIKLTVLRQRYNLANLRTAAVASSPDAVAYFEAILKAQMRESGQNPSRLYVTPIE